MLHDCYKNVTFNIQKPQNPNYKISQYRQKTLNRIYISALLRSKKIFSSPQNAKKRLQNIDKPIIFQAFFGIRNTKKRINQHAKPILLYSAAQIIIQRYTMTYTLYCYSMRLYTQYIVYHVFLFWRQSVSKHYILYLQFVIIHNILYSIRYIII